MAYATLDWNDNDTARIGVHGLQYSARRYSFRLFLYTTQVDGWKSSDSWGTDTQIEFNIKYTTDGRETANGTYYLKLEAKFDGNGEIYPINFSPSDVQLRINRQSAKPMTQILIRNISRAEENAVVMDIETNGYGKIDLISVSKGWDLERGGKKEEGHIVRSYYINEGSVKNGKFQGRVEFYPTPTDLSQFPSVPIGSCHLAHDRRFDGSYAHYSEGFLCLSRYDNWKTYDGRYSTTMSIANNAYGNRVITAKASELSSVYNDWIRLINMSFYLESTTYKTINYTRYSSYIPRVGDIVTASMYNSLLEAVSRCASRVGVEYPRLPSNVGSGQIISRNFIHDIGMVIDACLQKQKDETNRLAITWN